MPISTSILVKSSMSVAASRRNSPRKISLVAISRYDRVAGLLLSLIFLLGISVGILLFIWLAGKWTSQPGRTVPVVFHPGSGGDPTSLDTAGQSLEAPTVQEIERETDIPLLGFRNSFEMVDKVVNSRASELVDLVQPLQPPSSGGGAAMGLGDKAAYGQGVGSGGVARGDRWEIQFSPGVSLEEYRRQLDFFKIELAAVAPGGGVEYLSHFTQSPPQVERSRNQGETRLYMSWRSGSPRQEADRKLLESAGILTVGKQLVQFIPADVEQQLATLEQQFARRDPRTIRSTRFGIRGKPNGFEFYVAEQIPL